jgi:hypothetical protein
MDVTTSIPTKRQLDIASTSPQHAPGVGGGGSSAPGYPEKSTMTGKKSFMTRLAGVLVSVTIACTLVIGFQGKTAYAVMWGSSVSPGWIQAPTTQVHTSQSTYPQLIFPVRYAWRSNSYSTSTQVITVTYLIEKWDAGSRSWPLYAAARTIATVPVGHGAWMGSWVQAVAPMSTYHVGFIVQWTTTAGTVIGMTTADYHSTSDYSCAMAQLCSVQPDGSVGADVYVGM